MKDIIDSRLESSGDQNPFATIRREMLKALAEDEKKSRPILGKKVDDIFKDITHTFEVMMCENSSTKKNDAAIQKARQSLADFEDEARELLTKIEHNFHKAKEACKGM